MAGNANEPGRSVISKISAILLALAEGSGYTLTEIAARTELPLSTTHRLTVELAAWGVLARDKDGRYRAGLWGQPPAPGPFDARGGLSGVGDRAVPLMEDLFRATGTPVRVGVLDGVEVAYVEKVSGLLPVSRPSAAARLPMHATALGKALLAFSPARVAAVILAPGLRRFTSATVTQPERLRWQLRTIRSTRVAHCDGELDPDWCGVAAPVFSSDGGLVAAIELRVRDLDRDLSGLRAPLIVAAGALSRSLAARDMSGVSRNVHHPAAVDRLRLVPPG